MNMLLMTRSIKVCWSTSLRGVLLKLFEKVQVIFISYLFQRSNVDFLFRIDGKLIKWHRQEKTSPEAIAAVVKDRTNGIDRFERDNAQDGFAQRIVDGYLIRFRISVLPIISSEYERRFESVVIRVIDDRNVITDLQKLGLQKQAESDFLKAVNKSKGIILLTGPTGSGKSTTLMAALHHVIDPSKNVLTCEDPVEYVIKGARQLKIGAKMTFEQAIRSILRHDPDIVMVGEIRDKITADVAVKLANTGHLTFSTLHTNDAPSAISRLYKMGLRPSSCLCNEYYHCSASCQKTLPRMQAPSFARQIQRSSRTGSHGTRFEKGLSI